MFCVFLGVVCANLKGSEETHKINDSKSSKYFFNEFELIPGL